MLGIRLLKILHVCFSIRNERGAYSISATESKRECTTDAVWNGSRGTGIAVALSLLTQLELRQALLMGVTALIAMVNWWWAKRRKRRTAQAVVAAGASN